jgi:hypothetical protein
VVRPIGPWPTGNRDPVLALGIITVIWDMQGDKIASKEGFNVGGVDTIEGQGKIGWFAPRDSGE